MMAATNSRKQRAPARFVLLMVAALLISGCAALAGRDAPLVQVVGMAPLPSEDLELRFGLKLRVQNPDDLAIAYDGVAVELNLDGYGLASGVSDQQGEIPRFGETVVTVPITVSAFAALRQLFGRLGQRGAPLQSTNTGPLKYELVGKFGAASGFNPIRFRASGQFSLDAPVAGQQP